MNFLKFDLGSVKAGTRVTTTLSGDESDVFLVDPTNFSAMQRGKEFKYFGGHYKKSPVVLVVPTAGHWTTVVVPSGNVKASVEISQ
jgi:hypothetical protein